jgi:hypothetical protein
MLLCLITDRYRLIDQLPEADAKKQMMVGNSCSCHNYFGIRLVAPIAITLKVLRCSVICYRCGTQPETLLSF